MARRRKHRTHLKASQTDRAPSGGDGAPKSFIVKHGQVGSSITALVRDMRRVMEPNTATRLKERSRNKLKDYLTLAPALNVSHLLAFTLTPVAPSLRFVRLPAGPTFSFRIERYSLVKDIRNSIKHGHGIGMEYLSPPLLVLSSFPPASPSTSHLQLLAKMFQSLFPPLSPKTISLSSARRVVLIAYNAESNSVEFRHYLITVRPYGVSKRVRRIVDASTGKRATLDLSKHDDVADFLLRRTEGGYESASSAASSAGEESENAVSLPTDYVGRHNKKGDKRAVRLDEIGPRMELRLIKIVEGVPGKEGAVIHHDFVKKSKFEVEKQKADHLAREKLRKKRREEQERNVKKKQKAADAPNESDSGADDQSHEDGAEDDEDAWDDEEVITDGEETQSDESSSEESKAAPPRPPAKKKRVSLVK